MLLGDLEATIFSGLDGPQQKALVKVAQPLSFTAGERLWVKGDTGTFACVLEGAFDIVCFGVTVDTIGTGQVLGHSALWGRPHKADVRARVTGKGRPPVALVWRLDEPAVAEVFSSGEVLKLFLRDSQALIRHLNDLQILYRRKCGASAHVAAHLCRLSRCRLDSNVVEISQKELGELAGYDPRTVRSALAELQDKGYIRPLRRSVYDVDVEALTVLLGGLLEGG